MTYPLLYIVCGMLDPVVQLLSMLSNPDETSISTSVRDHIQTERLWRPLGSQVRCVPVTQTTYPVGTDCNKELFSILQIARGGDGELSPSGLLAALSVVRNVADGSTTPLQLLLNDDLVHDIVWLLKQLHIGRLMTWYSAHSLACFRICSMNAGKHHLTYTIVVGQKFCMVAVGVLAIYSN